MHWRSLVHWRSSDNFRDGWKGLVGSPPPCLGGASGIEVQQEKEVREQRRFGKWWIERRRIRTAKEEGWGEKPWRRPTSEVDVDISGGFHPRKHRRNHVPKGSRWQINLHKVPFKRGLLPLIFLLAHTPLRIVASWIHPLCQSLHVSKQRWKLYSEAQDRW